jgi:hypothetical protein
MSAVNFKVGDKVRVRKDLEVGREYGEYLFTSSMKRLAGKISVITGINSYADAYLLKHRDEGWTDEMLEPVPIKKTLKNMEKGDVVVNKPDYDYPRTVLLAIDGCYLLSAVSRPTEASCWRTAEELRVSGCTVQQPAPTKIETIKINGKEYNKNEVEEAIKDLQPIDPLDTDS